MATLSVLVTRPVLALPDLELNAGLYRIQEEGGIGDPEMMWRREYARSPRFHGAELTSAVKEQTNLPLGVFILASSALELHDARTALIAAFGQWSYQVNVTVDGISEVWDADPADVRPGGLDSGEQDAFLRHFGITVPIYPIPGSA